VLVKELQAAGVTRIEQKDFFADVEAQEELLGLHTRWSVPPELQSNLVAVIDDGKAILEGHVPRAVVRDLLAWKDPWPFERLLIFQGDMGPNPQTYQVWALRGEARPFAIETPLRMALATLQAERSASTEGPRSQRLLSWVVVTAGLLDGLSPCAFAVLLLLVAFLFAVRKLRGDILLAGGLFVAAVYVSYFLIGLGLLHAITMVGATHVVGQIGALLLILLGVIGLVNIYRPSFPIRLKMPALSWETTRRWIQRATLPSAAVAGVLVGLCTLPCSGGIYVAVLGLVATEGISLTSLGYLALYNGANIVPLVVVLLLVRNRTTSLKLTQWERGSSRQIHIAFAAAEIGLGVVILLWLFHA
jgi:cytochrome c biogenesis protein CcdA